MLCWGALTWRLWASGDSHLARPDFRLGWFQVYLNISISFCCP